MSTTSTLIHQSSLNTVKIFFFFKDTECHQIPLSVGWPFIIQTRTFDIERGHHQKQYQAAGTVRTAPANWHLWATLRATTTLGFPGGSEVKASASNAGDLGSIPGSGRPPGEGNGNPLQYSCLENPTDGGAWWPPVHGVAESDTTERLYFHFSPHLEAESLKKVE